MIFQSWYKCCITQNCILRLFWQLWNWQKGAKVENTYLANFEAEIVKVKVLQAEFGWIFFANTKNSSALYHLGPIFIN